MPRTPQHLTVSSAVIGSLLLHWLTVDNEDSKTLNGTGTSRALLCAWVPVPVVPCCRHGSLWQWDRMKALL